MDNSIIVLHWKRKKTAIKEDYFPFEKKGIN